MADDEYKVTISGPGMSLDRSIDAGQAIAIVQIAMSENYGEVALQPSADAAGSGNASTLDGMPLSLREYLDDVSATTKDAQILAIAKYLAGKTSDSVTKEAIKSAFAEAAEPLPKNYHRDFSTVLKRGWLAKQHGTDNGFYVTKTGNVALENNFEKVGG